MKASDYIAAYIERRGVTHVFELVGGMITFLLDSIHQRTSIALVSMHHEQGAGFAAEGFGRMRGVPGVAMATSGPGATNLLTAIGSCYFDSTPTVFITGQVNRHEQKGTRAVRQLGFQETDIVSMARPITKRAVLVNAPAELPALLEEAFALAVAGRPGPVLLDVPMDVQRAEIAERFIEMVHLRGFERSYVHQLSGGMRQRVAIARALALNPAVLLMDEPFGALDAFTRDRLHAELETIWESTGKTILFVTHNVREAVALGDRVLVFAPRPGRIVGEFRIDLPRPRSLEDHQVADKTAEIMTVLRAAIDEGEEEASYGSH